MYLPRRSVSNIYMQIAQVMEEMPKQMHHVIDIIAEALTPIVVSAAQNNNVRTIAVDDIEVRLRSSCCC